jgi:hypothetical protein
VQGRAIRLHDQGLDGVFRSDDADNIDAIVRGFNQTVDAGYDEAAIV